MELEVWEGDEMKNENKVCKVGRLNCIVQNIFFGTRCEENYIGTKK